MEWLLIAITFCLFGISARRTGIVPYPSILILILGFVQVIHALAHGGNVVYDMMAVIDRGGMRQNFMKIQFLYTGIAIFSILSVWGYEKHIKALKIEAGNLQKISQIGIARTGTNIALCLITFHFILYSFVVDWNAVWFHAKYLDVSGNPASVELLGASIVNTTARSLLLVAGLAAVTYCVASNAKRKGISLISGFYTLFYFLLLFSFHSRAAVLILAIVGANALITKPKARVWILPLLLVAVVFVLASALEGRASRAHGLSAIPDSFTSVFSDKIGNSIVNVAVNLAEGSFSTTESLQVQQPFQLNYKILSFSPLPSFVDGFSAVRATGEHRLHPFAPMSGYAEAILFGWPYLIFLFFVLWIGARLHIRLASSKPTLFLGCNFLMLIAMHYMFAYPIRNALRFVWLEILLSLIAMMAINSKKEAAANTAKPRANVMSRKAKIGVPQAGRHG